MTKTAITYKDLNERERHNKEMERQGRVNTILSGISNIGGLVTSVLVPKGGLLAAAKSLLSGKALDEFADLYQRKQKHELSNAELARYREIVRKIKGGSK